jgi:hypothetical protein
MRVEQLPPCSSAHPGVRAVAEKMVVHGKQYLCVVKYSACLAREQLNSTMTALAKVTQNLRRLVSELSKPKAHFTEPGIRNKIHRWLSDPFVREVLPYELEQREGHWHLTFDVNHTALTQLWSERLGRTTLLTNRMDWTGCRLLRPAAHGARLPRMEGWRLVALGSDASLDRQ